MQDCLPTMVSHFSPFHTNTTDEWSHLTSTTQITIPTMPKTHTAISLHTIPSLLLFLSSLPLSLSSFPLFLSFWLLSPLFASSFLLSSFSFRLLLSSSLPWLFFSLLLPYSFLLLPSFSPPRLHYRYHLSWN